MDSRDGKRIGIWLRVSTEDQVKGESPLHHEERARAFAKAKGWEVVEVYRLDAVSGKSVIDHPTTRTMLEHVRDKHIHALVFSKLARLARNTRELLELADEFREHEADLVSLQESIDTSSPAGRVFFTMIAAMAQWEREEISDRVAASIPVRAKLGKSTGGATTFGYRWEGGKLVPDPDEAPVRKLIYELYRKLRRKSAVADELNKRGFRTRRGAKFTGPTIGRLLADTTAKGVRLANYTQGVTSRGKRRRVLKPKKDWIEVPVEPIVSEELWSDCNRILEDSRTSHGLHRKRRRAIHLFSGYLFCGRCGEERKMYPQTNWDKYRCYKCANKIAKDDLETLFIEQMEGFLLEDEKIEAFIEEARQGAAERRELLATAGRRIEKVERKMDALLELYEKGGIGVEAFRKRFKPLEQEKQEIEESIPRLQEEIERLESEAVNGESMAADGKLLVEEWPKMSWDRKRETVENVVHRIIVDKDEIQFELQYLPGQLSQNRTHQHLFSYAKGHEAEWQDPNGELMAAVKSRGGKILKRG
jgi:site-specific DNA recombinase